LLAVVFLAGCHHNKKPDYYRQLGPGEKALRKIDPKDYPDFSQCNYNFVRLPQAVDNSLQYMAHASSQRFYPYADIDPQKVNISYQQAVASLRAFRMLIDEAGRKPEPDRYQYINQQIRDRFEVYESIGAAAADGPGYTDKVLFTGYCTPDREASLTRGGPYQWPIYKRPSDLETNPETGETLGRKTPSGPVPYWTRDEIEGQNKLAGLELAYLKSRWEAYVVTVQGSARLRLPDGQIMKVGFAGQNGYDYTSPGKLMVDENVIKVEDLNLRSMGHYFAANPEAMDRYLWANKRTVFFAATDGDPRGCLNVPVTEMATIATDKEVYPRAMTAFLIAPVPHPQGPNQKWQFHGFMMDQDAGGAIRAPGRADIYMGIGDNAEDMAGHQLDEGSLYYIMIKPEYVSQYQTPLPAEKVQPAAPVPGQPGGAPAKPAAGSAKPGAAPAKPR
jgi:membrane-bound lytic murein transglycosylase A